MIRVVAWLAAVVLLVSCSDVHTGTIAQLESIPPLPDPVTNNAVASIDVDGVGYLVSFSGLGAGKTHADTHAHTWVYESGANAWTRAPDVPAGEGRLASVAATADERIFVFGGYTVAEDGSEVSTPWVHEFDPVGKEFGERAPMPVPTDDAVAVVYEDRFIYLVSGWHDLGNINLVQRYDVETNRWDQATPIPGPGVFGHSGGIVGNAIVYCDGVAVRPNADRRRDFEAVDSCYLGLIDEADPRRIDWRVLPPHPGAARYRMAAAGIESLGGVLFIGGSDNPYNYDGIGYDGEPSAPAAGALLFDIEASSWRELPTDGTATMDHRGLVAFDGRWVTVGGMAGSQAVSNRVYSYKLSDPGS